MYRFILEKQHHKAARPNLVREKRCSLTQGISNMSILATEYARKGYRVQVQKHTEVLLQGKHSDVHMRLVSL